MNVEIQIEIDHVEKVYISTEYPCQSKNRDSLSRQMALHICGARCLDEIG